MRNVAELARSSGLELPNSCEFGYIHVSRITFHGGRLWR